MEQTIAAIATPMGQGGIGVIRISGTKAFSILEGIFKGEKPLQDHRLTYGKIMDPTSGKMLDEVLVVAMKAPKTYTCEDVAEIHCHGNYVALNQVLELCFRRGAKPAQPGEFTKRAFLNGRLDLTQAEAVIDVVKAKTSASFEVAMDQLEGGLAKEVKILREKIKDILVNITVNIDYPDEDIEEVLYESLEENVGSLGKQIEKLMATARQGKILRQGLKVSIVGKPNVGKSSLLNALLREERAIVSEIPGTTRDVIEEAFNLGGIPIQIVDTAGIRDTGDQIEQLGINRSKASVNEADFVILVLDGSKELEKEDIHIMDNLGSVPYLVMINKEDLPQKIEESKIREKLNDVPVLSLSLKKSRQIEILEKAMKREILEADVLESQGLVTNIRQENSLKEAEAALKDALHMVEKREALDFIEVDMIRSYELLGEIVGETVSDDIIDEVFSRFCLGK